MPNKADDILMTSYEDLLTRIETLPVPTDLGVRQIYWVGKANVLGVARTGEGRIEVFIAGEKIATERRGLRDALDYGIWFRHGSHESSFEANRIILPAIGMFDHVAAFICIELLMAGLEADLHGAFMKSEPVIDLFLERLRLSDGALLGLIGELFVLDVLSQRVSPDSLSILIEGWHGWKRSLRDISWGTHGIEVKTTSRLSSLHEVQGVHQVEVDDGAISGSVETRLTLVSLGLAYSNSSENALSLPDLVNRICFRLQAAGHSNLVDVFTSRVREYSAGTGFGYDHATMARDAAFTRKFQITFARGYDMTDPNIAILRGSDTDLYEHVSSGSVRYVIDLPVSVSGDLNPINGLQQIAKSIVGV